MSAEVEPSAEETQETGDNLVGGIFFGLVGLGVLLFGVPGAARAFAEPAGYYELAGIATLFAVGWLIIFFSGFVCARELARAKERGRQ